MSTIRVDHADDPRLSAYRNIRERDLTGRHGRFIAEGTVVLGALLSTARFEIESLLILENRLDGLAALLANVGDGVPIYVASRPVLDAVAGFPMHRGVLAVGLRGVEPTVDDLVAECSGPALLVVASGIANHDNIGAIFRNAAAFGAAAILLDAECCNPLYRKAIRVSVGAALKVPFARGGTTLDIARTLETAQFRQFALTPRGARTLAEITPGPRIALHVGTEGEGLPAAVLEKIETVRIHMAKGFDSLNVAAASAIALHALARRD